MRHATIALLVASSAWVLAIVACGTFGVSEPNESAVVDAAKPLSELPPAEDVVEQQEQPVLVFACGTAECKAGSQACCFADGGFGCYDIDAGGCRAPGDAGLDAATTAAALLCTTYRNCGDREDCCYRADKGSACMVDCPRDYARLCTRYDDHCDQYTSCNALQNAPGPKIGQCTGGSGGSNWEF